MGSVQPSLYNCGTSWGHLRALIQARAATSLLIDMLEQQTQTDTLNDDGHCGLDGMIVTHQQEQALGQDQDTVSDDGIEEAVPIQFVCLFVHIC